MAEQRKPTQAQIQAAEEIVKPMLDLVEVKVKQAVAPLQKRIAELERQVAKLRDQREVTGPGDAPR
jgi:hypothetical protein